MIAIITLVALMSAYLIANGLTRTQAEVAVDREALTQRALMEAKRRELEDAMNAASERAYEIVRHSAFLRRRAWCDRLRAAG